MRLIDADELKAYAIPCEIHNGALTDLCVPLYQIDNAPTVEPPNQLVLRARDDEELEQLKTAWGNGEICFTPIVAYTARPQGDCENCDFRKFTETFVDGVVDVMDKNGITSVEELQKRLQAYVRGEKE